MHGRADRVAQWGRVVQWPDDEVHRYERSKKLLVAPGLTSNEKLLVTKGIATSSFLSY